MYSNGNVSPDVQVLSALLITLVVVAILLCAFYILKGFGVMKLAQKSGVKNSGLAFVPIVGSYILGKTAFEGNVMPILFLGLNLISILHGNLFASAVMSGQILYGGNSYTNAIGILSIVQLAYMIFSYCAVYKIYKKFSKKAVVMTVLSVLSCGLLDAIFLFAIRNNNIIAEGTTN